MLKAEEVVDVGVHFPGWLIFSGGFRAPDFGGHIDAVNGEDGGGDRVAAAWVVQEGCVSMATTYGEDTIISFARRFTYFKVK